MNDEIMTIFIHPNIENEVSNWEIGSAIIPEIKRPKNDDVLVGYKDVGILKKAI